MSRTDYDTDFYAWTQAQAAALRTKDWQAFDLANLAEEIESLGKRDRRTLESSLKILLLHLLKWTYQSHERGRRGRSWRSSIANARDAIEHVLRDSPSLRANLRLVDANCQRPLHNTSAPLGVRRLLEPCIR